MGVLRYSVWIEATPVQVWRSYVDPTSIPDWQTGRPVVEDVHGPPGAPGSSYVSKRGPLAARTTVLSADAPHELVTRTEAYFGLHLEVTSRLSARSGGTDLHLSAATHWPRGFGPVGRIVEMAVLSPGEARKELANLKALVERRASA